MNAVTPHAPAASHGAQHYVAIWGVLCVLLVVSVLGPMLGIRLVTLISAFGVAIVKAYLVCRYFMHLRLEKQWVAYVLALMVTLMVVFFGGTAPDVLAGDGTQWRRTDGGSSPTGAGGLSGGRVR